MDDGAEEETGPILPLKRNASSSSSTFSSMVHFVSLSRRKLVRRWSGDLKGGGEGLVGGSLRG